MLKIFSKGKFISFSFLPLLIASIFILGRVLCPPSSWDELAYQLAVPMRWIYGGGSEVFFDNPYSAFPSFSGMIFRVFISNGGLLAPRLAVFVLFLISAIALIKILSPLSDKYGVFSITSSFVFSFPVLMISSSAYSEIFILANFAGLLLFIQEGGWISQKNSRLQFGIILGILAGAAASVKLTGLIFLPLVFVLILFLRKPFIKNTFEVAVFFTTAFLFLLIFYIRPYAYTGNPFYPYFGWLFSGENSIIEMSRYHHAIATDKYGIGGLRTFFSTPFLLSAGIGQFDGSIGLQYFIIFIFAVFSFIHLSREKRFLSFRFKAFILFLAIYAFWFFSSQQARFFVPAIFVLCIASTYFLSLLRGRKIVFVSLVILSVISISTKFAKDCLISWQTALGFIRRTDYLYTATGPGYLKLCDMISLQNTSINNYLLLFENRGLYLKCKYQIATPFFQEKFFTPPEEFDMESIWEVLRREKITDLIVGISSYDPDRLPQYLNRSAKIAELIGLLIDKGYISKIWEDEGFAIFKIKEI